ncbi:MAG: hypothetical protein ACI8R1_001938 [Psychrobacter glaciei]|uniref:hypothetical protein n=2 Tax=Psychrobacter glaciei TaxID=619771 RepID=UPI0039E64A86
MSLSIYQRHLDNIPKQYRLLKLFRPPIYVIELSNNQLIAVCYYKDGSSKRYEIHADFSNRRLLFIDFSTATQAIVDLLYKFSKHSYGVSGIAVVNVSEELLDGLTPVETRMIIELIHVASSKARRSILCTEVRYQGRLVLLKEFG